MREMQIYTGRDADNVWLMTCDGCGAVVHWSTTELHDNWHGKITEMSRNVPRLIGGA